MAIPVGVVAKETVDEPKSAAAVVIQFDDKTVETVVGTVAEVSIVAETGNVHGDDRVRGTRGQHGRIKLLARRQGNQGAAAEAVPRTRFQGFLIQRTRVRARVVGATRRRQRVLGHHRQQQRKGVQKWRQLLMAIILNWRWLPS